MTGGKAQFAEAHQKYPWTTICGMAARLGACTLVYVALSATLFEGLSISAVVVILMLLFGTIMRAIEARRSPGSGRQDG